MNNTLITKLRAVAPVHPYAGWLAERMERAQVVSVPARKERKARSPKDEKLRQDLAEVTIEAAAHKLGIC